LQLRIPKLRQGSNFPPFLEPRKTSEKTLVAVIQEACDWPYLWLDATYIQQREGGRIVSVAVIVAVAANTEGKREIVGLHIGPSEAETFWATFLKSMVRRGLRGVKLVISDAHEGLKAAIRRVMGWLAALPCAWDEERTGARAQGPAEHGGGGGSVRPHVRGRDGGSPRIMCSTRVALDRPA
jgi:transposase-like protein